MEGLGKAASGAAGVLALAPTQQKNDALAAAAAAVRARGAEVLAANERDMSAARAAHLSGPRLERLRLDERRIEAIATSIDAVIALPDPIGSTTAEWERPNGLRIQRVVVPLGVIGIIYESRPNVTADAGALCLKSGNAAILRGGSESQHSSRALHACLAHGLQSTGLPAECIQLVPLTDRAAVGYMLAGMSEYLDVIVPRGGKTLVERVQREARSEEHTSELQSQSNLVCRLLLEKKKTNILRPSTRKLDFTPPPFPSTLSIPDSHYHPATYSRRVLTHPTNNSGTSTIFSRHHTF